MKVSNFLLSIVAFLASAHAERVCLCVHVHTAVLVVRMYIGVRVFDAQLCTFVHVQMGECGVCRTFVFACRCAIVSV